MDIPGLFSPLHNLIGRMDRKRYIHMVTQWMEEHKQSLFRYACYHVGNTTDAEDILQDIYLRMLEKSADTSTITNLQAYVYRALINACLSHRRQVGHIPLSSDYEPTSFEDEAERIRQLIENMPEKSREIVRLKTYASMTFDAIADVMRISPTTAKRRYYEGLEYLRSKYDDL